MLVGDFVNYMKGTKFLLGFFGIGGLISLVIFIIVCFFIKKMFFNIYFVLILIVLMAGLIFAGFLFSKFGGASAGRAIIGMPGLLSKLCQKKQSQQTDEEKKWCNMYNKSLKNVNVVNELFKKNISIKINSKKN